MSKNWLHIAKEENERFNNSDAGKITDGKARQWSASVDGGITSGRKNVENGTLSKAGKVSAKKQWKENRENELKKCKKGGDSALKNKVGVHSLTKKELSKAGKKGYASGLGKLSKKEKMKIIKKASIASRDVNSNLTKEDVIFMRNNFIARHPKFGVVAFSKKYKTSECGIRNAIKGRTFKDVK